MQKFIVLAFLLSGAFVQAKPVDKIVAIVNDQLITLSDMEKFKKKLQTGGLVDDARLDGRQLVL